MLEETHRVHDPVSGSGGSAYHGIPRGWALPVAKFDRLADRSKREIVAAVINGELFPLSNEHAEACGQFRAPSSAWSAVLAKASLIVHSHPPDQPWPSYVDQRQQIATGIPWYIKPRGGLGFVFGDGAPVLPLLGRRYRFGVTDCFSLVRSGLRELYGTDIANHARDWQFWRRGEPVIENHLEGEGFGVVSERLCDAQPGDVVLFRMHSSVANHCGLILERGSMLHHPTPGLRYDPTTLSTVCSVARWAPFPVHVVRRYES